ncbi:MAG: hypothetical protein OEV40_10110 [Acidimicrobiia bacterium]|nr:hypothetical protein [Acidimicrobiia bacterium]
MAGPSWLGPLPRAEWTTEVGRLVGSTAAASEWANDIGTPDPDVLLVIDELRRRGFASPS